MSDIDYSIPIVIDNGTNFIKVGFATDKQPIISPNLIGRSNLPVKMIGVERKDYYTGNEVTKLSYIDITTPIDRGIIKNYNDMEKIIFGTFYRDLKVAPEEHSLLLTEPPSNSTNDKLKMYEIIFESFGCHSSLIMNQALLSLYASSSSSGNSTSTSGLIIDCGASVTHITPIIDGNIIYDEIGRIEFGGNDITNHLKSTIFQNLNNNSINKIKENPNGNENEEIINSTIKQLLQSSRIFETVQECILKNPNNISKLYSNIIVSGGTSNIPDFNIILNDLLIKNHLNSSSSSSSSSSPIINHINDAAWKGGSSISLNDPSIFITKDSYEEYGSSILLPKEINKNM